MKRQSLRRAVASVGIGAVFAASAVAVAAGPAAAGPKLIPVAGQDRYATAVAASKRFVEPYVVYIASGEGFADALSAGPAAVNADGPLLLTPAAGLPAIVSQEIRRLKPLKIVVVGGPAAVSPAVFDQLKPLARTVERIHGLTRYDTSREVARRVFGSQREKPAGAWIATGTNFPDALSGAAVAGRDRQPMILVPGVAPTLDPQTQALFKDLGTKQVKIAGDTGVVSAGIENRIKTLGMTTARYGGKTRYDTSDLIVKAHWQTGDRAGETPTAMVQATGQDYPDALTGGVLAGLLNIPFILHGPSGCLLGTSGFVPPIPEYYMMGSAEVWGGCFKY